MKRAGAPVLERDILKAILDYLQVRGIFAFRTNTGAAMLPGRGGRPQLVRFGFRGVADIIGIKTTEWEENAGMRAGTPLFKTVRNGRFLAIEIKGPKGKQTDDQAEFQRRVEEAGGIYCLARSLEDVRKVVG